MPRDNSIKKVLVIGSGPIVIGQAAEFDYSGTQACQAIREEGIEVVLVNSNPATIMTDKEIADKIYIEPLTVEFLEKVIAKERPDSLLAGVGGQTALNLAVELYDKGVLDKYNVRVIGTQISAIKEGEDRELFRALMARINQPCIESDIVESVEDAVIFARKIGYPVVVRPAYTLGGTGGGIAETEEELRDICASGLHLSRVHQVLIEKCIKGWKEIEYEVMRDSYGTCITVCNMENIDPVGIHTGDSIVVAPSQTLSDREYQMLRRASLDIISACDIRGGCNVQLALNPDSFEYAVIEINPRVSRSSALASKATGYPIARVSAKIALGYGLDEIPNTVTGKTYACFEPTLDYVVCKIPKWPFDKFYTAKRTLGTKMMATGEIMAIGNNFESAFLKGLRSLEIGKFSFKHNKLAKCTLDELKEKVVIADDERIFALAEMLRRHYRKEQVCKLTGMDIFFVEKFRWIVEQEERLAEMEFSELTPAFLRKLKKRGFADKAIAELIGVTEDDIRELRFKWNIVPVYKMVDTCGGEFEAESPYYYSTYDEVDEVEVSNCEKVMVIGSGPIRIGQGIEFDYCSVHAIMALKKKGIETIIVNNNPETVSTDFNTSDKLYFEPLTDEDFYHIFLKEKPMGVILQFGGQTAIKLAKFCDKMGIPVLGTHPKHMDEAEDREKFDEILEKLHIKRPKGKAIWSIEEGLKVAEELEYPVLVRPSYVLGGQGMEITYEAHQLERYLINAFDRDPENPVLIDRYLMGREIEVDALSDGENILIPGIMEHLERAGIHSGDSTTLYPSVNIPEHIKEKIITCTQMLAKELKVLGMINIQYIEYKNDLYIIEVNPRSSRTVPYISKVTGVPIIDLAVEAMLGKKIPELGYGTGLYPEPNKFHAIKVPVFSTEKLPRVEVSLGPEMKSTGEVLGVGETVEEALYKGFVAAGRSLPKQGGTIFATIQKYDQDEFVGIAKRFANLGYKFIATDGTAKKLEENGIPARVVEKLTKTDGTKFVNEDDEIFKLIRSGEIDLVVDTPTKGNDSKRDGFRIRRIAVEASVQIFTSLDTVRAMADIVEKQVTTEESGIYDMGVSHHE
ncbi:carbamoyl-phosphate synthase large subunit [Cellulosilyticum ruminicola]|uniref:carbamoyl-phosphate synthase large subunit n=1 Tax=Cellulosilyticum ruminicola TaxID=425254 RepID=UPI0006CFBE76|nr:carbamoyl-phosphate synthase large subunit [Cellulosilyticum ruminicola]